MLVVMPPLLVVVRLMLAVVGQPSSLWFSIWMKIVCAYETSSLPPTLCSQATEAGLKNSLIWSVFHQTREYRDHVKDLTCISQDLSRVVIVDNNPFSFLLQPVNRIPCVPFSAGQPHDDQLLEVLLPLRKHLSVQEDVRPILYENFHMPEWFQKHGIPSRGCIL